MYFRLFADCLPVKGAKRSTICDLKRGVFKLIPNMLYEIQKKHENKSVEEIKECYDNDAEQYIDEYYSFLIQNEFGFLCNKDDLNLFPDLKLDYHEASKISNFILDIGDDSHHDYKKIFSELCVLQCKHLEIRFFRITDFDELEALLLNTQNRNLRSIHLFIPYKESLDKNALERLHARFSISRIDVHSVHHNELKNLTKIRSKYFPIFYTSEVITDETHCGVISASLFQINVRLFTESQIFNTCLNNKMSIDKHGIIRNCPSMDTGFGHIDNTSMIDIANDKGFTDIWSVKKDNIDDCKACEFRHICTDCRAYLNDDQKKVGKPAKCNYNPYTAVWQE